MNDIEKIIEYGDSRMDVFNYCGANCSNCEYALYPEDATSIYDDFECLLDFRIR